jgi:adenine-specific DNA methylase
MNYILYKLITKNKTIAHAIVKNETDLFEEVSFKNGSIILEWETVSDFVATAFMQRIDKIKAQIKTYEKI